jgi:Icc-related predicted phosphoesterase
MKILAVSDVESRFIWEHFDPEAFKGVELIISCGDLKASYLSYLVTMIPAPLFYVFGNHDQEYISKPPFGCESIDGRVLEHKGLRIGGLGGCMGSDPTNVFQYSESQMEKRVRRLESGMRRDKRIDIFVTHAPMQGIGEGKDEFHRGFACFRDVHRLNQPKLHLFGHKHLSGNPVSKSAVFTSGEVTLINCTGYRIIDTEEFGLIPRSGEPIQKPVQRSGRPPLFRRGKDING